MVEKIPAKWYSFERTPWHIVSIIRMGLTDAQAADVAEVSVDFAKKVCRKLKKQFYPNRLNISLKEC